MVVSTQDEHEVDCLFQALADATRRDILRATMTGARSVTSLAQGYPMSFAAVQKHVAVLERAGLVTKERRGREVLVRTDIHTIRRASHLLDQFEEVWRDRIDRIRDLLADPTEGTQP